MTRDITKPKTIFFVGESKMNGSQAAGKRDIGAPSIMNTGRLYIRTYTARAQFHGNLVNIPQRIRTCEL